jgi:hypothetical protein
MRNPGNKMPELDHREDKGCEHQQQKVNVRQNSKSVMKELRPAVHEFSPVTKLE